MWYPKWHVFVFLIMAGHVLYFSWWYDMSMYFSWWCDMSCILHDDCTTFHFHCVVLFTISIFEETFLRSWSARSNLTLGTILLQNLCCIDISMQNVSFLFLTSNIFSCKKRKLQYVFSWSSLFKRDDCK